MDNTTIIASGNIASSNTIEIEGGTYLPKHFNPTRPDPGQFVQYEYPLHNQLPSTEDGSTVADDEASGPASSQGETEDVTFKISPIQSLKAEVYPWRDIKSDFVSKVRVIELQHDGPLGQANSPYQILITEINRVGRDQYGDDRSSALDLDITLERTFRHRVSLRGTIEPERLRLLVCIPHFSSRETSPGSEHMGKTLAEYRNAIHGPLTGLSGSGTTSNRNSDPSLLPSPQLQISVNQTCFMVVNSEMIIMVRTANNEQSSPLPFFPGQHRACVLNLLVHMISIALQFSTQAIFGSISNQYLAFEGIIQKFINDNTSSQVDRETRLKMGKIKIELDNLLLDTHTMIRLIQSQIQALNELHRIVLTGYHHYLPRSKGYHSDAVKLPLRLQKQRSLKIVLEGLETLITERERFRKEFEALYEGGSNNLRRSLEQQDVTNTSAGVEEQTKLAKKQAETMSMFTVVTTLFLPLTFFTSYFALEPGKLFVTQSTGWKFWAVAAPVTFIFTMATLYIVLMKKYRSGEYKSDGWLRRTFFPNINTSNTNPV